MRDTLNSEETEQAFTKLRRAILDPYIPDPPYDLGSPAESWGVNEGTFNASCAVLASRKPSVVSQVEGEINAAVNLAESLIAKTSGCMELGYEAAAKRLAFLAAHLVMTLDQAARRQPSIKQAICEFSEQSVAFPVMLGAHKNLHGKTYVDGMMKFYSIGTKLQLPQEGYEAIEPATSLRPTGTLTTAQVWVERLAARFHFHPRLLFFWVGDDEWPAWVEQGFSAGPMERAKPLTDAEARKRFQWAWEALIWASDGKPETIEELATAAKGIVPGPQKTEKADWPDERLQIEILLRNAWVARFVVKKPRGKGQPRGWVADLPPPPKKSSMLPAKPPATRVPRRGPKL